MIPEGERWNNEISPEVERLLITVNPDCLKYRFITPSFCLNPIKERPKEFPILSGTDQSHQKRYISLFLKRRKFTVTSGKNKAAVYENPNPTMTGGLIYG